MSDSDDATLPRRDRVDHTPGRAQHWANVDADIKEWVIRVVARFGELGELVGVYLHGSLAMGSFYRPNSDVDLLVVSESPLATVERARLARALLELFDERPITGGLELSVMTRAAAESFEHPAPYEFHFSEGWVDEMRRGGVGPSGTDPDLAAHCSVVRSRGVAFIGPPPVAVFGEVPPTDYLDAVVEDLRSIVNGDILASPVYGVLNICRCAAVLLGGHDSVLSKDEGGAWAIDHLPPEHRPLIGEALACYRASAATTPSDRPQHGHRWNNDALLSLADWTRTMLLPELG